MQFIESKNDFTTRFSRWTANDVLHGYPFVENIHAPFTAVRRALPMLNLGLVSSASAYIDGTEPFDIASKDGDLSGAGKNCLDRSTKKDSSRLSFL